MSECNSRWHVYLSWVSHKGFSNLRQLEVKNWIKNQFNQTSKWQSFNPVSIKGQATRIDA